MRVFVNFIFPLLLAVAFWAAPPVAAQDSTSEVAEKSALENWLQDTLSEAGREVTINGFAGAFSSNATFDELTIADDEGIWLRISKASLVWSRSALLSGRVDINEISAEKVEVLRKPLAQAAVSAEDSESWQFTVPELPVSVEIDALDIKDISFDASVLGQALNLALTGKATLAGGAADVDIKALRSDDLGEFNFAAKFANETRQLTLDLGFREAAGGMVATLLKIPDTPALAFSVKGDAPLEEFTADIALQTDADTQFGGTVRLTETTTETGPERRIQAALSGDLRPLFIADYHPFFGARSELTLDVLRPTSGLTDVQVFSLQTGLLQLNGAVLLDVGGLPKAFDVTGQITSDTPVRLPTSDVPTTLRSLRLEADFDDTRSNVWNADISISDFERDSIRLPSLALIGTGNIDRLPVREISGTFSATADGLAFDAAKLAEAFDGTYQASAAFSWVQDGLLRFDKLQLRSDAVQLAAAGTLGTLAEGFPLEGRGTLIANDLSRYSLLAGRDIAGSAHLDLSGRYDILGGGFDAAVFGATEDLKVSEPRLDPLLAGRARLRVVAERSPEGTELRVLNLHTDAAQIDATGSIDANAGQLQLEARLVELALVEPKLSGPADVSTDFGWTSDQGISMRDLVANVAGTSITGSLTSPEDALFAAFDGDLHVTSPDIAVFSDLAGRALRGAIDINLKGSANLNEARYALQSVLTADNLQTGIAQLDPLLRGEMKGQIDIGLANDLLRITEIRLRSPQAFVTAQGEDGRDRVEFELGLENLGLLVPEYSGPLRADGQLRFDENAPRNIAVRATGTGPGGIALQANGTLFDLGQRLDIALTGSAPLALANPFIAPNSIQGASRFDLQLRGAPSVAALSGQLDLSDGRMAMPDSGIVLSGLAGDVRFAATEARLNIRAQSGEGGTVTVQGPVSLQAPNRANLSIALANFGISDPELFQTSLDGTVTVDGPLQGQALIAGRVNLGRTEIVVPSGSPIGSSGLLDVTHVNAPRDVRATLDRAGVGPRDSGGSSAAYPLNIVVVAPNQIFVRGRGLDAELGGQIRLGGTTADVAASGNFGLIRGRFDILGRRFVMNEGLIDMRGSLDPFLRFVAETQTDDGAVRLILEGLASSPDIRFETDGGLPQEEAISRLLFGRGLDSISPLQAASLVSAVATLSGRSSGGLTGRLRSQLGLSDFDVTQSESGAGQLRAGAYLNENTYSEIVIDSVGNQEINLNLDITPNLTVKGGTGSNGNTGVGIFFEKDY
ncbi:translocation/assembly module TamB domain-containing protein [Cognatishimia maritima]|uniref:Autotransporter secretion inner membrane protein TamB n=1 Tax=Cognatishimia maritima TaxID=870908 RepID=A0A1M5L8D2_9RHOB|nr:translocation/assembly module TamB domain-containing protein [Cognatishimia maritima]SHG61268.1 autotransporter secretion inner membrane protein TamB [Cognatishimia maritima]